jgi:hypothetical protein
MPAAPPVPQAPAGASVHDAAVPGPNVVNYIDVSDVLDVLAGIVFDPPAGERAGIAPITAHSVYQKVYGCSTYLTQQHGGSSVVGQVVTWVKHAGTALAQGRAPGASREQFQPETWLATLDLAPEEAELWNRCVRQSDLREGFETRALRTCLDCKLQRMFNPDYERIVKQRAQVTNLFMPRNAVLAVYRMYRDPKFVCSRCQGLQYSERTIVLCPTCGEPSVESFFTACRKCGFDFRSRLPGPVLEGVAAASPIEQSPPLVDEGDPDAPEQPVEQEPVEPRRILTGKCVDCGNEFRVPVDKIPNAGLRAKCSQCGRPLTIRRPREDAQA